ncbi:heparinase II/III family protein [Hymenobacter sp. CRA2]|uniref:heparinase II/III domain-containing protein n=1 Tax=Hymenobacter sp. CRA2 TaxID=1955620 RepID=UPI001590A244|nr:heparinase II/III family protein [Hymenobacter sp. CRA2]
MLTADELPAVRAAVTSGTSFALYASLVADVAGTPPADNTSSGGRRARATFAKNAAFVALLNQQAGRGAAQLLPAADRTRLLTTARGLLETMNPGVEPFASFSGTQYTEWQWRSKELIDYLVAYDLLRGAGEPEASLAPAKARLQLFAGNLYLQSTKPFLGVAFYKTIKNNHTLMTAAALGMAAAVLNDATSSDPNQQPTNWANAGLFNLDNVLWEDAQRQSDPAAVAGYAEGPYYFKYAFLNCLPLIRTLGHFLPDKAFSYSYGGVTRSIPNPYFDPRYDRLYQWITAIQMPDGRFPALEDSYIDMGMPELALTGKAQYANPLYLNKLNPGQLNTLLTQLRDVTVDMRAAYLAANITPAPPQNAQLTSLPLSGNLVFRSGNDSLASYLHVYGKNGAPLANSGGHNQGDAGSFILHAQGQLLALDPGYLSYNRREEIGNASNHNLVLVDGAGPVIGSAGNANDAAATVQNAFETPQLAYGEVATAYNGARLTRKTLFVRGRYFLLADAVQASAPHAYTWQLHGYGLAGGTATTGTFTDSLATHTGIWQKNGASLLAHVTAQGAAATYTTATRIHELTYNTTENHTALLVQSGRATQTQFLAALYPFTTHQPRIASVSTASTAGLTTTTDRFRDLAFAQSDTLLRTATSPQLRQAIGADGLLNFYSADSAGRFAQLFIEQGTVLQLDTLPLLLASRRATISWQQLDDQHFAGYVSRATTLRLAFPQAPPTVSGAGVSRFSYDADAHQLRIEFSQASAFTVVLPAAGKVLPVELMRFGAERQRGDVALTWQTATELRNAGFTVERRTGQEAAFQPIGYVAGAGTSAAARSYRLLDNTAPSSLTYYRLRQVDTDGTVTYSPVAVAPAAAPEPVLMLAPNPADAYLTVRQFGTAGTLQLLDTQGRRVLQQSFQQEARLDTSHLPAGLYYLQLLRPNARPQTGKVLVVH